MSHERRGWRAYVPERWSWLRLFASPSSYLLAVSFIMTAVAKLAVIATLDDITVWPAAWLCAIAADLAVFFGIATVLAFGERSRWVQIFTTALAALVTFCAVINAIYLATAGEQLNWQVVSLGMARIGDVRGIATATLSVGPGTIVFAVIAIALPVGAHFALRGRGLARDANAKARAHAAASVTVVAAIVALVTPMPDSYALRRLHGNAIARAWLDMITGSGTWSGGESLFAGYHTRDLVTPQAIETLRGGAHPNVILVVLESVRRDVTTLGGGTAKTPSLAALAARGLEATAMRSALPHTTKSLWSMLCGRLPLMQPPLYELTARADAQCLAAILAGAGWRTAFMQSAVGTFEDRPRLTTRFGFADLVTAEDLGGERLGYLASDDAKLPGALAAWIDREPAAPFFATILTSGTHHPYIPPPGIPNTGSDEARYIALVEHADRMVGEIVKLVAARGLTDHTIVIVLGDHGEGFGDKGVRQHSTNFFEEGLRVPFVMAGPGIAKLRVDDAATLVDVTPTILGALGVELSADAREATVGRSILHDSAPDRVLPFGCWYDMRCRGFVRGTLKVVFVPETGQSFTYDLATDPREQKPMPLREDLAKILAEVGHVVDSHRALGPAMPRIEVTYPAWTCPPREPCRRKSP